MSLPSGTVGTFLLVLTSAIVQQDRAEEARALKRRGFYNPHGLGLMLEAAEHVRDEVSRMLDSDSPDALRKLGASIETHFTPTRWRDGVLRQIEEYIVRGKLPTLKTRATR